MPCTHHSPTNGGTTSVSTHVRAAISTCVKAYAEMERTVESIIANGPPSVSGADSRVIVTRTDVGPVSVSCRDAEPYLAKLG